MAAPTLGAVVSSIFNNNNTHSQMGRRAYSRSQADNTPITSLKYMEIPISGDTFELPVLAFNAFLEMLKRGLNCDTLVAQLYSCGQMSTYKSLDAIMRDVMSTYTNKHLSKVEIAGTPNIYYATFGTVFDHLLRPLMMLSWIMERRCDGDGRMKYHYQRPLLRLNPQPCLEKEDPLQRFLANKLLTNALGTTITTPYFWDYDNLIEQSHAFSNRDHYNIKVEIDDCPFVVRSTDTPSISVTNEALLQMAADHLDEILQ